MEALGNTYLFLQNILSIPAMSYGIPTLIKCLEIRNVTGEIFEGTHRGLGPTMNHISLNKYSISSTEQELTGVDFTESLVSEVIWKI